MCILHLTLYLLNVGIEQPGALPELRTAGDVAECKYNYKRCVTATLMFIYTVAHSQPPRKRYRQNTQYDDIKGEFDQVVHSVSKGEDYKELRRFVLRKDILHECDKKEVRGAMCTADILTVLKEYYTFIEYKHLEDIVHKSKFCSEDTKSKMTNYTSKVKKFVQNKTSPADHHFQSPTTYKYCVAMDAEDLKSHGVKNPMHGIAEILGINPEEFILIKTDAYQLL